MAADDQLLQRRKRALANPVYFHLAYVAPFDPNWPKDDDGNPVAMPEFAQAMLRHVLQHDRSLVQLPPEFLKTTLLSQTLPTWLTYRSVMFGEQLRGLLMSEEEDMAKANLAVVKWHIKENPLLLRDFSDERGVPIVRPSETEVEWSDAAINVERVHPTRDPTWQAKGLDSKGVHGRRLDWFIGDDLVTPRNADSPAMRKKALTLFDRQVRSRLVAGARACVAGNFNDLNDLLHVLARRRRWQMYERPSLHLPGQPTKPPKESQIRMAVPTWPGNWSLERCLDEFDEAPNTFKRMHLFDPRAEHGEVLQASWVTIKPAQLAPLPLSKLYMAVDPASGSSNEGGEQAEDLDYFNCTVGALYNGQLWVIRSLDVRCKLPRQIKLVGQLHDAYNRVGAGVQAIGVSKQHLDSYWRQALTMNRPDLVAKTVPISVPQANKGQRLEGLGPVAQSGYLVVADDVWDTLTSDEQDRHQELSMRSQWTEFPFGAHDDRLDGLDLLVRTATEFADIGGTVTHALTTMPSEDDVSAWT